MQVVLIRQPDEFPNLIGDRAIDLQLVTLPRIGELVFHVVPYRVKDVYHIAGSTKVRLIVKPEPTDAPQNYLKH